MTGGPRTRLRRCSSRRTGTIRSASTAVAGRHRERRVHLGPHDRHIGRGCALLAVPAEHYYDDFMASKQGGFSQVMHRFAEVGKMLPNGKKCECLLGVDANALYLYAMGGEMPVDKYEIDDYGVLNELLSGKIGDNPSEIILQMLESWDTRLAALILQIRISSVVQS